MARESEPNPAEEDVKEEQKVEKRDQYIPDDFHKQQQEEDDDETTNDAQAFFPSPPPDELFEISTTVDPSYIISLIRKLIPTDPVNEQALCEIKGGDDHVNVSTNSSDDKIADCESMDVVDEFNQFVFQGAKDEDMSKRQVGLKKEDVWEEYGCVLWDLAASRIHAELMVQNLILEVLLANLMVSQSVRVTEICLGIIGNLACHEVPMKQIVSNNRLVDTIVEQLLLDDIQCLCEACRLLTLGLQSSECNTWIKAIRPEHFLSRILWVVENTLSPQLLEKGVGLLLAVLGSRHDALGYLLPLLVKLGLPSLLINLLDFEMTRLTAERMPERFSVLDVILHAIEALSVLDGYSQEICSSEKLLELLFDLVKVPDKFEIASSCVAASILIANILSDAPDLATMISDDVHLLQGLLETFPFASNDSEARCAIWSNMAWLLLQVKECEISLSSLRDYVSLLVSKSDLIEDLLDRQVENLDEEFASSRCSDILSQTRSMTLQKMISILDHWTAAKGDPETGCWEDDVNVARLLDCCRKHVGSREEQGGDGKISSDKVSGGARWRR